MSSVERFNRTLQDRYTEFKQRLDQTVSAFATAGDEQRLQNAGFLASAGQDLLDMLTDMDLPDWVRPITKAADAYVTNSRTARKQLHHNELGKKLLQTAVLCYHKVAPITIKEDLQDYNFDNLYERLRDEGRLPELFDQMIDAVRKMIESGEIDSVTVINALKRLLDVLAANRNGSYVAVRQTLDYAKFIRNCGIEFLKRIPGIKEVVDAYAKTLEEAEEEQRKLEEQLRDESLRLIVDQAMVERLQQLPNKEPLLLEVSGEGAEPQESVDESSSGEQ